MATEDPVKNIKGQLSCSICLDLFKDPVIPDCGHSFCRECITQHSKEDDVDIFCPLCKKKFQKRGLRPNRELKNIVESIPHLLCSEMMKNENTCMHHQEPLNLYCKSDLTLICVICERSPAHQSHCVIPLKDAMEEYRKTVTHQLRGIESNFKKLNECVNKFWKNLPRKAREEEHERLTTLLTQAVALHKGEVESTKKRCEDPASQTQLPDSQLTSSGPEEETAAEIKLHGEKDTESISKEMSAKQKTATHVVGFREEAPTPKHGLDHASLDPTVHRISNTTKDDELKVDSKDHKKRAEDLTSQDAAVNSGVKRKRR